MITQILFIIILVALDQYSKILAVDYLIDGTTMTLIPNILGLKYAENTGAAFSIFSDSTTFLIVFTSITILIMVYIAFISKDFNKNEKWIICIIIAGGIGNLIDRIRLGYVIDYFEVLFMDFAIFNVADVYVNIGVFLAIIYTIYNELYKKKKDKI